jgi:hypothetical protein
VRFDLPFLRAQRPADASVLREQAGHQAL